MKSIGMLRIGNELDFIQEMMLHHVQHFNEIYFLDDSNDGGGDIVRSFPEVIWSKTVDEIANEVNDGKTSNREWLRQSVMEKIINDWGDEDVFVTFLHGDEWLWNCPIAMAQRANYMGWKATVWNPMHFFLHTSQRDTWKTEWAEKPILERLRFYCPGDSQIGWPGAEVKQIKLSKNLHYIRGEKFRYYPHGVEHSTNPPPYPVYLHVGYRDPKQAVERARRNVETGFQPEHRGLYKSDGFIDCLEGLSEVCKFEGDFGERELPDLYKSTECGHERKI